VCSFRFPSQAVIAIDARLEGKLAPNRLGFRFEGGSILLRTLWNGTLALPYPVPFALLGDNAKVIFRSIHTSNDDLYIDIYIYIYIYISVFNSMERHACSAVPGAVRSARR